VDAPASTFKVLSFDLKPKPTSIVLLANVLGKLTVTAPFVTFCFGYTASSISICTVSPSKWSRLVTVVLDPVTVPARPES
jgi:hypothetical protein